VTIKSDMEVMDDLSIRFKEQMKIYEDSNTNLKSILTDLEYLLHQVDTAEVFVKNRGYLFKYFYLCYYNFFF